jgi:MscS family membrane protein
MRSDEIDVASLTSSGGGGLPWRCLNTAVFWLALVSCLAMGPDIALGVEDEKVGVLVEIVDEQADKHRAANTLSPRDTLRSFIDSCNEANDLITTRSKHYDRTDPEHLSIRERVLDTIDDSELPAFAREDRASEAAAAIKEILDRVKLPPWEEIPDAKEIAALGGTDKLIDYRIPGTRITISRVEQGPRRHEYLFSPGTVERAPRYFKKIAFRPYRTKGPKVSENFYWWYQSAPGHPGLAAIVLRLPESLRLKQTLGLSNWKWFGLLATLLVAFTLMTVAYRAYVVLGKRMRERSLFKYWLTLAFPIAAMLIPLAVLYVAYYYLTLRSQALYIIDFAAVLIALLAALVVIFAFSNRIAASVIASPSVNPAGLNAQLIRITAKLASVGLGVALFLSGGQYLGFPLAALLASAGIGGIALALGAQDTLKTLFGTINLLTDKPCRVGEQIIFKEYTGVVEDIGLRSTKIRLFDGNLVTIPNDLLAVNNVENVGRRQYIRRVGEIHIPLDTPCEKVEQAVAIIRDALHDHEGIDPDRPPRVFFKDFAPGAFSIQFMYWYAPPDIWKFRAFSEKLNFDIFRRFEAEGIQFSLPFRHSFWKHDDVQGPVDVNLLGAGTTREHES